MNQECNFFIGREIDCADWYRVYSCKVYHPSSLIQVIWEGDNYAAALKVAKEANINLAWKLEQKRLNEKSTGS